MRARLGVPLVLVLSTVMAMLIGMHAATGQTVLHLVVPSDSGKARFIDANAYGLHLADRVASRGPITSANGTKIGTSYGDCVVDRFIRDSQTGLWTCSYVLHLEDGDVMLEGLDPRGSGSYEMAVLGGTGAYANASGDATFTDTPEDTDMMVRLSG